MQSAREEHLIGLKQNCYDFVPLTSPYLSVFPLRLRAEESDIVFKVFLLFTINQLFSSNCRCCEYQKSRLTDEQAQNARPRWTRKMERISGDANTHSLVAGLQLPIAEPIDEHRRLSSLKARAGWANAKRR